MFTQRNPVGRLAAALVMAIGAWGATAQATEIVTFSSFIADLAASGDAPLIPGRGAGRGQALPAAWGWNYSGNAADAQLSVYGNNANAVNNIICVGPAGQCSSNNNDGVAGNEYAGYEFIHFNFALPANATQVAVHFLTQDADDRHALLVNGTLVGGFKGSIAGTTQTLSNMLDGQGSHSVVFQKSVAVTLSDPTLFHPGQANALTFWINNTYYGFTSAARAHVGSGDLSALYTAGWISYELAPVPEPGGWTLLLGGLGLVGFVARRRRGG